ncbi:HTH-type transcriptional regulator MgrA [Rubripirellula lacrimiformis]|uniref:HTH-type transcriptional regulator MgrA n=1 Tax=Rubripirellula lacrimiformis TaxID=1930273 RepID=A0A517N9G2_9BACT|nr:MarR family transcriptional regulator [Rubripirellula lacrimiformis]QDT03780.1 HTH-type transcriptional regulator MgrA [Rubripirellula lacrimiformis]
MTFEDSIPMRLRRAYLAIHRVAQAHFASFDVTADQFVLLSLLAEEDGVTQSQLGDRMASDGNTVTAMLKLLEQRDYIRRKRCKIDGRARRVHLTASGRRLSTKLSRSTETLRSSIENAVSPSDRKHFHASLDSIIDVVTPKDNEK